MSNTGSRRGLAERGRHALRLNGDTIGGTTTLRDGTIWRKISLRRAVSN